jgi:hypothetical protein
MGVTGVPSAVVVVGVDVGVEVGVLVLDVLEQPAMARAIAAAAAERNILRVMADHPLKDSGNR